MKLHFLGAAGTVTGSRYLLVSDQTSILVDCGLFQGYKQLRLRNWEEPPFDPSKIDAVLLTHAHLDHSGYLPLLVKLGFKGKIYCSKATFALCRLLLRDSAHLFEEEAAYLNRHHLSKHEQALPLYDSKDVDKALKHFHYIDEHTNIAIADDVHAKWVPNGHILGSCSISLKMEQTRLLFSGDVGRPRDYIMKAPEFAEETDYLIVESTYGDRLHSNNIPENELRDVINNTVQHGGSVLIPSFAVGRAQTLLYLLYKLRTNKQIPNCPIYLDSPMSESATGIYSLYADSLKLSAEDIAGMLAMTTYVKTPEESQRLNGERWPKVIISASGMATGGRVLHHMKYMAPDDRNSIVFCGHQAGGTRGESLLNGASTVRIHGQDVRVRAKVVQIDGLSAHADYQELLGWLKHLKQTPLRSFITHGEPAASDHLRQQIERELDWRCEVPEHLSCYKIDGKTLTSLRAQIL
ncbi:MBL fold metallo-hydrolase [Undibacterium sp. TS12]|uniref:MBL fold metallo-hydrolase RNA specificity domain-containing protein n=1 Tax=Undibacterium sp. TS12 TaxID=2908202 RepID=UPI001F4C9073|nr:MBL fold metallo-hydrolase [Undibacterium sp. TS12]